MAYGDSPFLAGCLASLRNQTLAPRVVVTTSTPSPFIETAAAAASAPMVVNARRAGIAADWNFAMRTAQARYVTLAHQDDTYGPTFLAETLTAFNRDEGVLCFTSYQEIDDEGMPVSSKISKAKHLIELVTLGGARVIRGSRLRAFLSLGDPLPCSSVTFDMVRLGDFAFSDEFAAVLDWDAWWRLMVAGETFLRVPQRLVGRRHNALTETSKLLKNGTRRVEDLAMFRRAWPRPWSDLIAFAYRAGY
jgi:hypothetical protein